MIAAIPCVEDSCFVLGFMVLSEAGRKAGCSILHILGGDVSFHGECQRMLEGSACQWSFFCI